MSQRPWSIAGAALVAGAVLGLPVGSVKASGLEALVQATCLAAVEQELAQSGKEPPAGLADYACRCVVDRLVEGMSVSSARSTCRASTARRFAL
ncbi:MAG: hypothetical protein ACK6BG_15170 [Cyanobacteriota bacterium]|jgi:hypothetical protein